MPGFGDRPGAPGFASLFPTPDFQLPGPDTTASDTRHPIPETLHLKLVGANPHAKVAGLDELPGKCNYFIGNDPKQWRTNVPNFRRVRYQNVYPGIDVEFYGSQGQLEYDFVVHPGADPKAIKLAVGAGLAPPSRARQAVPLREDANGDVVLATAAGEVRFRKPVVYQEQSSVVSGQSSVVENREARTADVVLNSPFTIHHSQFLEGKYLLSAANELSFKVPGYDRRRTLVIDPVLSYSTYLGSSNLFAGSNLDVGYGIAADSSGNAYVTGFTNSTDFPTVNPFQATFGGGDSDAFVTKLNPTGSALVYSTYLGGSSDDVGGSIAVDSSGNAYVTGYTNSTDFPTVNPFQATFGGGGSDAFATKLNPAGSALLYSTYLGGSGDDVGASIVVDSSGSAYIAGTTDSTDFPTANPFQPKNASVPSATVVGNDAFVTKLAAAGAALVYSTYLGGSGDDGSNAITVDSSGNAYITGSTDSNDFPTLNPFQATNGGGSDAFVTKFDPAGSALAYSTYLGGSGDDVAYGIAVDSSGNAYVTGSTASEDFPTMIPLQAGLIGVFDMFVTKVGATGTTLAYSTYLDGFDSGYAIGVDASGEAYVAGVVGPTADAFLVNAIQGCDTNYDALVAKLNADGTGPVFSTCLGGGPDTLGFGLGLDSSGNAYVTGCTDSAIFPTIPGAFQPTGGGGDCTVYGAGDAFVSKISPLNEAAVTLVPASLAFLAQVVNTTSGYQQISVDNLGSASATVSSISITGTNSGDFALDFNYCGTTATLGGGGSCNIGIIFTPSAPGPRMATLTVADNAPGSPQTASLTGTGTPAAAVGLSSTALNFGSEVVGTTSGPQTVTVTNSGSANLTVSTVFITGTNASDFTTQSDSCAGTSVAPNSTCQVALVFKPSVSGSESATLSISDNASGSPQGVALSGTGQDFSFAPPSGSSTTASVSPGSTATYTLSVGGEGGLSGTASFTCTGAPSEAACAVSPNPATVGSSATNVTVTVTTTAPSVSAPRGPKGPGPIAGHRPALQLCWLALALLALLAVAAVLAGRGRGAATLGCARKGKSASAWPRHAPALLALLLVLAWAACGGGGPAPNPGTPAGTYTLTVTATLTSSSGTLTHTIPLTLTVN